MFGLLHRNRTHTQITKTLPITREVIIGNMANVYGN